MEKDYDRIMELIRRNDYFYNHRKIDTDEYIYNNLFLASKLENILNAHERQSIKEFLSDSVSLAKFKLSISILKTVSN